MATLTIRNFPDDLRERLRESAKRNRRSMNQEGIVWLIRGLDRFDTLPEDEAKIERARAATYGKRLRNGQVPKSARAIRMLELGEPE